MASDNLISYYLVSGIHLTNLISSSFFQQDSRHILVNVYELTKRVLVLVN